MKYLGYFVLAFVATFIIVCCVREIDTYRENLFIANGAFTVGFMLNPMTWVIYVPGFFLMDYLIKLVRANGE